VPKPDSVDRNEYHSEQDADAVLTIDRGGRVLACNDAARDTLAVSAQELIGSPILRWILPDEHPAVKRALRQIFSGETSAVGARITVLRGDGVQRRLSVRVLPLEEAGRIDAVHFLIGGTDPARPSVPEPPGGSVLIVDDDDTMRGVMRRMLLKAGYQVSEASSGASALERITTSRPPEFILTDLQMPEGSGYWLLDRLAKDFPQLLRRTVIVTGEPSSAAVERIARATGCPLVRKPFDFQTLVGALQEVANRS